eukprot:TRINITY_DN2309_c1_g1_i1.p1 TRINITY_DN2309_c1_g1~~TRINITY_DN2309_c1_g1_i1.p1  ORF type:complete len:436 (+),score=101.77 TRINITY_DN2309_c1_g1_i1:102-1409(+)
MLGVGVSLPTSNFSRTLNAVTTFHFPPPPPPLHSNKTYRKKSFSVNFYSSSSSTTTTTDPFLSICICNNSHKFSVPASRKRPKQQDNGFVEMTSDDEEEEEEEEEEEMMPFEKMRRWLRNKPSGFGDGKVYDTWVEDTLIEEMEHSRTAQLSNINNLKNNPPKNQQQQQQKSKPLEVVPRGVQVRVGNLPRKKNIHRDLQKAFKGFPDIVNISPAVSGNKKTRDPVCKGFAFLHLESEAAANRFLQMYSKQSISFGKIQKQITIDKKIPPSSSNSASEQVADTCFPGLKLSGMGGDIDADSDMESLSGDPQEETLSDGFVGLSATTLFESLDDQPMSDGEEIELGIDRVDILDPIDQGVRPRNKNNLAAPSSSSSERGKKKVVPKNQTVKEKSEKALRLNVLRSANRLKMKERSVLTGVFSKYGGKAASAFSQET